MTSQTDRMRAALEQIAVNAKMLAARDDNEIVWTPVIDGKYGISVGDIRAVAAAHKKGTSPMLTDVQIKHMVDRFLGWKLPENFIPDAGISFKAAFNEHMETPSKHTPSGTNLFDAEQATAMVRYMIEEMPAPAEPGQSEMPTRYCAEHETSWNAPVNHCPVCQDELAAFLTDQFYHHTKNFSELAGVLLKSKFGNLLPKSEAVS